MIAVTGATGSIGGELVRRLSRSGAQVRALTRQPEGQPALAGVEWRGADLEAPEDLAAELEGAQKLFLLSANSDGMVRRETNALAAAADAGVRHVVKLSALGASKHSRSVIGLWHHNTERELRDSGLAWTILRPHHFMQNLLDPLVFDRATGVVYSASGDGKIPFLDTRDIAAAAERALSEPGHEGLVHTLTGPRALSYREATHILSEALGRPLEFRDETPDQAFARRRAAGQPVWLTAAQLAIAGYQRAGGPTAKTTDTVERLTGRPATDLEAWAADHLDGMRRR